jgi:hypothetical protein
MFRLHVLSFDMGVLASDGSTHPFESIASCRHASISVTSPSARAALRNDCSVFGVSTKPL